MFGLKIISVPITEDFIDLTFNISFTFLSTFIVSILLKLEVKSTAILNSELIGSIFSFVISR